jgi:hypothetical protein
VPWQLGWESVGAMAELRDSRQSVRTFLVIPFHLQSVPVHAANCDKTHTVACRRVLTSAPL